MYIYQILCFELLNLSVLIILFMNKKVNSARKQCNCLMMSEEYSFCLLESLFCLNRIVHTAMVGLDSPLCRDPARLT